MKKHTQKVIFWSTIAVLLVASAFLIQRSKDQHIYVPMDGMIIFERQGGYLFTNDSGNLFWYNKVRDTFYQLNDPVFETK